MEGAFRTTGRLARVFAGRAAGLGVAGLANDEKWRKAGSSLRAGGLALSLPFVMLSFALAGVVVGKVLANWTGWSWILQVAILLGVAGGIWESVKVIKRLSQAN